MTSGCAFCACQPSPRLAPSAQAAGTPTAVISTIEPRARQEDHFALR
jgi:hypothetical protein